MLPNEPHYSLLTAQTYPGKSNHTEEGLTEREEREIEPPVDLKIWTHTHTHKDNNFMDNNFTLNQHYSLA